jgi:4-hydroxy-tetrahydrodipicolinate synthase
MMTDAHIAASGVVSVASNVAPAAVQEMTQALNSGDVAKGRRLAEALQPLFDVVTVKTQEASPYGERLCKARNPLPTKALMCLLGVPVGPVRPPLGKMTSAGLARLVAAAKQVWSRNPEILAPLGEAFSVDIEERLSDPVHQKGLAYED